jgi:hypothetical protein
MRDGNAESVADVRWLIAAGRPESGSVSVAVDSLTTVALWYAYEIARNPSSEDIKVGKDGYLVIYLNDDANPPGWYHYRRRAGSDDDALALVREKFGEAVTVPICAMLSERAVGAW